MNRPETDSRCIAQLPKDFRDGAEPVFREPWQAQAFALAVHLIDGGLISWDEWANALGDEIRCAADHGIAEDGSGYYELWLRALEGLVAIKELDDTDELADLSARWRQAYEQTPHGLPVELVDVSRV